MEFIKGESEKRYTILQTAVDHEQMKSACSELTELSLAHLIVFNRRRSGEMSKLLVDSYSKYSITPIEPAIEKT